MIKRFREWLKGPAPVQAPVTQAADTRMRINAIPANPSPDWAECFKLPEMPDGVVPASSGMAMDSSPLSNYCSQYGYGAMRSFAGQNFLGYGTLALLAQKPLIRAAITTLADEMTRKWVTIKSTDKDGSKDDEAAALFEAQDKYKLRDKFREAADRTGFLGGCMLFIDMGVTSDAELASPLILDKAKIGKGKLKGFNLIEPMFTFPAPYNSAEPLKPDFYKPEHWYVMGKKVHASRLLRFVQNEVPVLLKPAYNFFGIPMAQMMLDYEEKFDIMRSDAGKIVTNFRTNVLKTNMGATLQGGGLTEVQTLQTRAMLFATAGSNDGVMLIDKTTEELQQLITPMSGLAELVNQALELMAAICRMPAVKLLGISPKGFNSDNGADTNNWHEQVKCQQGNMFADNLNIALDVIQLSEFGEIDDTLVAEFCPLKEVTESEAATNRKMNADTDAVLVNASVLSPEEVRQRIARDPSSGYNGIDVNAAPEPVADPSPDDETT
jgi:phage-related protein (TIGR01555 family)